MNSFPILIIWVFIISLEVSFAAWIRSPEPLPNEDDEMAVGAWEGKILLFGAYSAPRQLTEIDTLTKTVTNLGKRGLSADIPGGWAQYWTQVQHIVYMIDGSNPQFNIYNMIDRTYTTNWMGITIETDPGDDACLATDSEYLYVLGGKGDNPQPITTLQILSISTQTWLSNPPPMNQEREDHACVVHNGYLWAFGGGGSDSSYLSVNERISTTNILSNTWDDTIDPLTIAVDMVRCVGYYDIIYVIGGEDADGRQDIVHLVDANTGTVTVSPDRMPDGTAWHSPIIWENVLYVFGGFSPSMDDWAYYPLPTPVGSDSPTQLPTVNPTREPTFQPSGKPTVPSFIPTALPSTYPTVNTVSPSHDPTSNPTVAPSVNPTTPNPTASPSSNPTTSNPSTIPTELPSFNPTVAPSVNPTTPNPTASPSSNPTTSNPTELPSFNPSATPTALPSSNPTTSPSSDPSTTPTESPSFNPSITSDVPTLFPTSYPSLHPSLNPSLYPTLSVTFASETHYTISITINECSLNDDGSECAIDEVTINNILIAVIEEDVQILGTEIVDNKINIIIAIMDEDYSLNKDEIQREMEVEYGDVDVTIKETEDVTIKETAKTNTISVSMIITIGTAIAVIGAVAVSVYLLYNCHLAKKEAKLKHMIDTNTIGGTIAQTPGITSDIASSNTWEPGSPNNSGKDEQHKGPHPLYGVPGAKLTNKMSDSEQLHVNPLEGPHPSYGIPRVELVNKMSDSDSDSEELYVVKKDGFTPGFTKR